MTPLAAILAIAREAAPLRELVRRLPLPIVRRAMEDLGAEPDDRFADLLGYAISIADELDDLFRPGSIASATAPIADDVIAAILEVADGPAFAYLIAARYRRAVRKGVEAAPREAGATLPRRGSRPRPAPLAHGGPEPTDRPVRIKLFDEDGDPS